MSHKAYLTMHGGVYAVFALTLFFLSSSLWPIYGLEINDKYAYFLSQHTSIFFSGMAAISLYLRDIKDIETMQNY